MKCFTHGASTWDMKGRVRAGEWVPGSGDSGSDTRVQIWDPLLARCSLCWLPWEDGKTGVQVGRSFLLTCVSPNNHHFPPKILSFDYQHCASDLPQPSPYGETGWRLRAFPQLNQEWDLVGSTSAVFAGNQDLIPVWIQPQARGSPQRAQPLLLL